MKNLRVRLGWCWALLLTATVTGQVFASDVFTTSTSTSATTPLRLVLPAAVTHMPVMHGGRLKPLQVAAYELRLQVCGSGERPDIIKAIPAQHAALSDSAFVLSVMLDSDNWGSQPFIANPYEPLQRELRLGKWLSMAEIVPHLPRIQAIFQRQSLASRSGMADVSGPLDAQLIALGERFMAAQELLAGAGFQLLPLVSNPEQQRWAVAADGGRALPNDLLAPHGPAVHPPAPWRSALLSNSDDPRKLLTILLTPMELALNPDPGLASWPQAQRGAVHAWIAALRASPRDERNLTALSAAADNLGAVVLTNYEQRRALQVALGVSPDPAVGQSLINLENSYHRSGLFTWAWVVLLSAAALAAFALRAHAARSWTIAAAVGVGLGSAIMLVGMIIRLLLGGNLGMVAHLYDTLIFVGWFAAVISLVFAFRTTLVRSLVMAVAVMLCLGLIFGWFTVQHLTLAGISGLIIVFAPRLPTTPALMLLAGGLSGGFCAFIGEAIPPEHGAVISNVQAVLRNQFWLWVHVKIIVGSYAPFMLAWILGNAVLIRAWRQQRAVSVAEGLMIYRCMQVGVVMLVAGTLLGGIWAAESWGRFWGWDPKEVYALVAILTYLIPLHLRFAGVVGPTGLAAWGVGGFLAIVMSWYGTNFILGAGKHAYANGNGGQWIVIPLCVIQTLWLIVVINLIKARPVATAPLVPVPVPGPVPAPVPALAPLPSDPSVPNPPAA